jgi:hypothetical protein
MRVAADAPCSVTLVRRSGTAREVEPDVDLTARAEPA